MDDDQQFCLRWNNHQFTLVSVFDTLLEKGMHVDCTLAAEGQTLKAHKVVLSACSPYFESVLSQQYDKHPIIILKDVKFAELKAMMDYMYRGEVNISQDQLGALLKAAESLQIKGLSDNKPSRPPSRPVATPATQPPRAPSPPPQVRDGSIDSREGSASPSRRRKKPRRTSEEAPPPPTPAATDADVHCKEEHPREALDDLTIDEDVDEHAVTHHNDVVRNFQWHMERSQDEIMNSSDSIRDSQGPLRRNMVTRNSRAMEEPTVATLAVLKPPKPEPAIPPPTLKENKATKTKDVKPIAQNTSVYACSMCSKRYNARRNLVRHVTLECGREPQYKCPHCTLRKHRRNELKKHIEKKHPTASPYEPKTRDLSRTL